MWESIQVAISPSWGEGGGGNVTQGRG
jgi:hypothetical protein